MYGLLPCLFSLIGLTNNEFEDKKKARLSRILPEKNEMQLLLKSPLLDEDRYSN